MGVVEEWERSVMVCMSIRKISMEYVILSSDDGVFLHVIIISINQFKAPQMGRNLKYYYYSLRVVEWLVQLQRHQMDQRLDWIVAFVMFVVVVVVRVVLVF